LYTCRNNPDKHRNSHYYHAQVKGTCVRVYCEKYLGCPGFLHVIDLLRALFTSLHQYPEVWSASSRYLDPYVRKHWKFECNRRWFRQNGGRCFVLSTLTFAISLARKPGRFFAFGSVFNPNRTEPNRTEPNLTACIHYFVFRMKRGFLLDILVFSSIHTGDGVKPPVSKREPI